MIPTNQIPTNQIENSFLQAFHRKVFQQVRFNLFFLVLITVETVLLLLFIPLFIKSALLAFIIAIFLLTVFAYFLFMQYYASQKSFFLSELVDQFVKVTKEKIEYQIGNPESYIKVAKSCHSLSDRLYLSEYRFYSFPKKFSFLSSWVQITSCFFHWKDVLFVRTLLLEMGTTEHLSLVRAEPTNMEAHALLANCYVMLSGLYADPRYIEEEQNRWYPKQRFSQEMQDFFQMNAKKAIEEFKILKDYTPNDPWIYTQLAYSYHDLKMYEDEKNAYEMILKLRPNDHEIRHKLGLLYFQQGENAKGLKIYEDLKKARYEKADDLLLNYGNI